MPNYTNASSNCATCNHLHGLNSIKRTILAIAKLATLLPMEYVIILLDAWFPSSRTMGLSAWSAAIITTFKYHRTIPAVVALDFTWAQPSVSANKFVGMECCLIWDVMMGMMKMAMAAHLYVRLSPSLGVSMEVRYRNPTVSIPLLILSSYSSIRSIRLREAMQVFSYLSSLLPQSYSIRP